MAAYTSNFKIIPVNFTRECIHYLYCKQHTVREQSALRPEDQTLFVVNIPPYMTKESFQKLFSKHGQVRSVVFQKKPSSEITEETLSSKYFDKEGRIMGYKVAYIVFVKPDGLRKVLKDKFLKPIDLTDKDKSGISTGVEAWSNQYNETILVASELEAEIDDFMSQYDESVEKETTQEKTQDGVPDSEGWVTVTKHGRKKPGERTQQKEKRIKNKAKRKQEQKELKNFYRFQIVQSKKAHLDDLKRKFDEDKDRIAKMKEARKFKPY